MIRALEPFGIADALGFDGYSSYVCTSGRRAVVTGYEYYCSATLKVERGGVTISPSSGRRSQAESRRLA